jgi:hypothetical protein
MVRNPTETQTGGLPNTRLKRYRYTNLLDGMGEYETVMCSKVVRLSGVTDDNLDIPDCSLSLDVDLNAGSLGY